MGVEGIGARVARKEDKRFISGRGRYTDDMSVPGMCHAAFVRSPHAHAKIVKIDSLVPLTAIESVFQLGADALHVSKATFEAAKGRISIEPTDVPLAPGKTISGVVVIQHLDLGELLAALRAAAPAPSPPRRTPLEEELA